MSTERKGPNREPEAKKTPEKQPAPPQRATNLWRKGLKRALILFLPGLLLILVGFSGCITGSPLYLWNAAAGQVQILCARTPIIEVLKEPDLDANWREKLQLVLRVQEFSRQDLSLDTGDSFQYFSAIDRDAAAYNVVAAPALSLNAHTYWFPIVGTVPYLGFFSRQEADEHAQKMEKQGLDVVVQEVAGYSTLGWFDDPLLSSQLAYSDYGLIRLVIHEAVHSTVWIPGSVPFNESLASFVEEEGSLAYIARDDANGSKRERLKRWKAEREQYRQLMHATASRLEHLYSSDGQKDDKLRTKERIIEELKRDIAESSWKYLDAEALSGKTYNNAHFLSYLAYSSGQRYFYDVFRECKEQWPCFLHRMRALDRPPADWNRN